MADDGVIAPPITEEMREQALNQPGSWLYCVDPFFAEAERAGQGVPPFGVIGAYQVDSLGEIGADFTPNPNYLPSPLALNLTEPANQVEQALQLAATGYGGEDQLRAALLAAELLTARGPSEGAVLVVEEGQGQQAVQAYTSEQYVPESPVDPQRWQRVGLAALLPTLRGRQLSLNPNTELAVQIPGEELVPAKG